MSQHKCVGFAMFDSIESFAMQRARSCDILSGGRLARWPLPGTSAKLTHSWRRECSHGCAIDNACTALAWSWPSLRFHRRRRWRYADRSIAKLPQMHDANATILATSNISIYLATALLEGI